MISPRFKHQPLSFYPRMSQEDTPIWSDFLFGSPIIYDGFDYDVRVGTDRGALLDAADADKQLWADLRYRRIDAVGFLGNERHIFEVKPKADSRTIGQVYSYGKLYRQSNPATEVVYCHIVARAFDFDDMLFLTDSGVLLHIVLPDASIMDYGLHSVKRF